MLTLMFCFKHYQSASHVAHFKYWYNFHPGYSRLLSHQDFTFSCRIGAASSPWQSCNDIRFEFVRRGPIGWRTLDITEPSCGRAASRRRCLIALVPNGDSSQIGSERSLRESETLSVCFFGLHACSSFSTVTARAGAEQPQQEQSRSPER